MPDSNNINAAGNKFCHRLRQARELLGISRSELARRVGVKPSAAIQWERENGTHPSTAHLIHIATVTDVAFEWLATGRGLARRQLETVSSESLAMDLFEELLLKLGRAIPERSKEPLLALLKSLVDR